MNNLLFQMLNEFDKECKQIAKRIDGSELEEEVR